MTIQKNMTLARHIKWVIGNRIMLCLISLSIVVLLSSLADIISGYKQVNSKLNSEAGILAEHIIAQSLINNKPGIIIKIKELNEVDRQEKFEWHPVTKTQNKPKMKWIFPFSWVYFYPVVDNDGVSYGEIRVSGSRLYYNPILFQLVAQVSLLLIFSAIMFLLLFPLSSRIPQDLFINPIMNLLILLKNRSNIPGHTNDPMLPLELREIQEKIIELINELTENARKAALGHMATQVAHDIRSPLSALDVVAKNIIAIPEEERILMRSAIGRIHDIANNLLSLHKEEVVDQEKNENVPEYIADLVLSVISEKRVQYKYKKFCFDSDIKESAYCAFSNVSGPLLKRVLSNLLDNAIEAINKDDGGLIRIIMFADLHGISISIEDNGCGITMEVLQNILEGKKITSKKKGCGLGVSHAIKIIRETFGGCFDICSTVGIGTRVDIVLPRVSAPQWFASNLMILPGSTIVILDDDDMVHQVWRKRFNDLDTSQIIIDFFSPDELCAWYQNNPSKSSLFLVDYELIGSEKTGLDIIEQLGISSCSYLVTNRYEEAELRYRCNKLGLRMMPKLFSTNISIIIHSADDRRPDLIFIDDDNDLIQAWMMRAKMVGKNVVAYNGIDEFRNKFIYHDDKDIPIYIDSDLGKGIKGQHFAKELYESGFSNIYLSTGYQKESFCNMPWIKEVRGKHPPF